ncbi:serrate RNA effector molecule homolog isoform X2 [Anopheles moucheti]|uniref:serrate RNA effector molecule homolog isoform X2 n=1 Tax=Anopheles moucheti TaxID=186751 RepID=UPI0022F03CC9|nr:serrate RNA effector molecule homolog isoform X2 [Anopheles moucheti]
MGDSDDEYDRKRRDKFRGERSAGGGGDSYGRGTDRPDRSRGRDDWPDRVRPRQDYRDYRPPPRDRGYSPAREGPTVKRMRGDAWGDEGRHRFGAHDGYGMYGYSHDHFGMHPAVGPYGHQAASHQREPAATGDMQTQPCMMTLKQFLATQDDSISDSDAITKYNEYKLEFRRQQMNEFFVAHKDEEWFKIKYHPEESQKRKEEQLSFLKHRCEVFLDLLNSKDVAKVSVDASNSDALLRLLDTVVIKLEGGTEEDLQILDEKPLAVEPTTKLVGLQNTDKAKPETKVDLSIKDVVVKKEDDATKQDGGTEEHVNEEMTRNGKSNNNEDRSAFADDADDDEKRGKESSNEHKATEREDDGENEELHHKNESEDNRKKRSRSDSGSSSSSTSSSSSSDSEEEKDEHLAKEDNDNDENSKLQEAVKTSHLTEHDDAAGESKEADGEKSERSSEDVNMEADNEDGSSKGKECSESEETSKDQEVADATGEEKKPDDETLAKDNEADNQQKAETIDLVKETPAVGESRALHRTSSIFLRNLAPSITKAEVEAMCRRYNGFLRVAIADPLLERRWFRRGWVTFKREVNIKEICWNLNNIRLRDCELGAIVNKDLSRRVRPVNGITCHKTVVRSDIKLGAKIAHNLDDKWGLWKENASTAGDNAANNGAGIPPVESFGLQSKNPVLQNITDYLIEEASAEEEELLGLSEDSKKISEGELIERDPQLIEVLDRLILYLRVVHSVDFYNHCEYPYEDEMPNRCGIIHARGPPSQSKVTCNEIQEYIRTFEGKMASFLTRMVDLEEAEMKKLGAKDAEAEVEKFITANTQELAKDKWLCPLSGKKFKGPDFVRKHIFNKHAEKVEEVRKEVEYFNNYLKDAKRPQLPEHPGNTKKPGAESTTSAAPASVPGSGYRSQPFGMSHSYAPMYAAYAAAPMMAPNPRGRAGFGRGGRMGGSDYRPVIQYRDLDAPREPDEFL